MSDPSLTARAAALLLIVISGAACLRPGRAAAAGNGFQAKLRLTSSRPNTPTGAVLNLIRPDGPDGKPKTESVGVFQLPPGTKVSQTAVPACTKDDTTWQAEGPAACPQSFIGTGFVTLYTGLGPPVDPVNLDQQWYYAPGQLVQLVTAHGTTMPVLKVLRVDIKNATFTAQLNDLPPGYPPGTQASPKETDITINSYVGPHGAFLTTPPTCPRDGKWVTTVTLHYSDGSTDQVSDATPCVQAARRRQSGRGRHRRPLSRVSRPRFAG
jgi:hypothetical protein